MITPEQIHAALGYGQGWDIDADSWNFLGYGAEGQTFHVPGYGTAIVRKSINSGEEYSARDYVEHYVIFELNGQFFRKRGYYGDWTGPLVEVEPYEKTVIDYREKQ